jgi:hypothetical protein
MDKKIIMSAALALSACAGPLPVAAPADGPSLSVPTACQAERHSHLIGQPEGKIAVIELPEFHRIICHNCPVTRDYRIDRLNLWLDEAGVVARIDCG